MRRHLTTLHLLLLAFGLAAMVAVSTSAGIYHAGRQVQRQTRQLMENGLPSLLAAVRLQEILPEFRLQRRDGDVLLPPAADFTVAVQRFRHQLRIEDQRDISFAGEDVLLEQMAAQLDHLVALAEAQRRRPRLAAEAATAYETAWAKLQTSCKRFHRLNEMGMARARTTLTHTAAEEEASVVISLVGILLLWSLSAAALTWSIARPLATLTAQVRDWPGSGRPASLPLAPWTPLEIRRLGEVFAQVTAAIDLETTQRRQAQTQLEAALEREHTLSRHLAETNLSLDEQVRQKTAELAAALSALQERDHARSSFLAAVSHELRAPLAVITGASRTLLDLRGRLKPDEVTRLTTSVVAEADHLSALLSDLLDVARKDAGSFRIQPEADVDLGPLASSVAASLEPLFAQRAMRLQVALPAGLAALSADPERVRQVLRNLLENAAKYAPAGSTVTLSARQQSGDGPERLEVTVDDEGDRIPASAHESLFTAFERGGAYHLESGGTGLGLAVARQLVEAHGGRIGVADRPGGGCRFWFWLPLPSAGDVTT
jgi:signal transduction histidine kinase